MTTPSLSVLRIGLCGAAQRLTAILSPEPGRSPHDWLGPTIPPGQPFEIEMVIHAGMGPGGVLWREAGRDAWSSFAGASAWGAERLPWPSRWCVGQQGEAADEPFAGSGLAVSAAAV